MYVEAHKYFKDVDIAILSAAVADYKPSFISDQKNKKERYFVNFRINKNKRYFSIIRKDKKNINF
jgi:phosphopantothenoylcysteine decarboxylase/phosphopantothenate--cysteine ligase